MLFQDLLNLQDTVLTARDQARYKREEMLEELNDLRSRFALNQKGRDRIAYLETKLNA